MWEGLGWAPTVWFSHQRTPNQLNQSRAQLQQRCCYSPSACNTHRPCRNSWCVEEMVVEQELTAQVRP